MSTPLNDAYEAANRKGPRQAVTALVNCFGSRDGTLDDVPVGKHGALIKALLGMANPTPSEFAMTQAAFSGTPPAETRQTLDDVRRDAFARIGSPESERPTPPKTLDVAAIYDRWNHPPTVDD